MKHTNSCEVDRGNPTTNLTFLDAVFCSLSFQHTHSSLTNNNILIILTLEKILRQSVRHRSPLRKQSMCHRHLSSSVAQCHQIVVSYIHCHDGMMSVCFV